MMKKLLLAAAVLFGIGSAPAKATVIVSTFPAQYQSPKPSSTTGYAIMWITGVIEVHRSTGNPNPVVVISSTGGVQSTIGIVTTTMTINGLLTGIQANFSQWITASSATFASSMTAQIVNVSTLNINGVNYTWPSSGGAVGSFLTFGAGGALSWAPSTAVQTKPFKCMVVGTANAQNVDAYVANTNQFNLILSSFGMNGLTYATTGQGCFIFTNGNYQIPRSTNPAGSKIICGSSVTFQLSSTDETLITNYGTIGSDEGSPCYIDAAGLAFASQVYVPKAYSVNNVTLIGGQNQAQVTGLVHPARYGFYVLQGSSITRGNLWFKEFRTPGMNAVGNMSTLATFVIDGAENTFYSVKGSTYNPGARDVTNGHQFLSLSGSTSTRIVWDMQAVSQGFVGFSRANITTSMSGYVGVRPEGFTFTGDPCVFCLQNYQEGIGASSGTVFENLTVQAFGDSSAQIFRLGANGATVKDPWNVTFSNVKINCLLTANTYTGIYIGSDAKNTVIDGAYINTCNTGINNGGVNTKGTAYINGIQTIY